MKKLLPGSLITLSLVVSMSVTQAQTWTARQSMPGNANDRDAPLYFDLAGKIYVGGGFYSKDMHAYNPDSNTWAARADIPGSIASRINATGFSINGKAYMVGGAEIDASFNSVEKNDVWEYDPVANSWTPKNDMPASPRRNMASFVINNKAYLVGGLDSADTRLKDVWEYNPQGDSWAPKADFPTDNIYNASGFAIGGKGYVVLGNTKVGASPSTYNNTMYQYNPDSNTWSQKANFPGTGRANAITFVLDTVAYCGQGNSFDGTGYVYYNDFYKYNATANSWGPAITNFPGAPRQSLAAGVANGKAYVGTGWTFISGVNTYYKDWYRFSTTVVSVEGLERTSNGINCFPNPAGDVVHIEIDGHTGAYNYALYNMVGQKVKHGRQEQNTINVSELPAGQYVLEIVSGNNVMHKNIVVVSK